MCVVAVIVESLYHFTAGVVPLILAELLAFSTTSGGQRHSLTTNANVAKEDPRGGQPELQPGRLFTSRYILCCVLPSFPLHVFVLLLLS